MGKNQGFKCSVEECEKSYSSRCNLNRHIKLHHQKIAFVCPICQKKLSSKQSKDEHIFSHRKEKPYVCSHPGCTETFRQASQLSFHKKLHKVGDTADRPGSSPEDIDRQSFQIPFTYLPLPWALKKEEF